MYVHHICIYSFINNRSSVIIPEWHLYYNMFSKEHNYYYLKFWPIIILVKNDLLPFNLAVHFKIYHRLSWATKLVKDQEFRKFATSLITMISWYTCLNNVHFTQLYMNPNAFRETAGPGSWICCPCPSSPQTQSDSTQLSINFKNNKALTNFSYLNHHYIYILQIWGSQSYGWQLKAGRWWAWT